MEASVASDILEVDSLMEDGAPEPTMINSVDFDLNKFQALLGDIPNDFEAWTSLITHVEKTHPNDIERICLIYDAFLSEYPLCYGYWNKYASHKARLCTLHEVEEIFERAAQAVPYSVDQWVSYCSFGALAYEDANDIRRLYERGLSFVKKDYLCHQLWDKYIDFEHSLKKWRNLAHLFIRILVFPSRKLQSYYERFKRLVHIWSQEIGYQDEPELPTESIPYSHGLTDIKDTEYEEISNLIKDFMDQQGILSKSSFRKYLFIGEQFYHRSRQIDEKISCFESQIRRRYFHVKPLDAGQLDNWHQYLDFVEMQGDFDWTVKLYERCLIACANYSDFWMRYVEYVEAMGGREIANHALARAVTVFLKKVPAFRIYSAMFKEKTGDVSSARALFIQKGMDFASNFIETINRKANMEKRMGNIDAAYLIYEKSIELAKVNGNLKIIPNLYNNFARFTFVASGSIYAARGVFLKGIQELPCKSILEGLIQFTTIHGGALEITILDTIIANALEPGSNVFEALSSQDREDISRLFLEFVDLHGNIHEIRRAWDRHWKLFPHIMRPQLDYAYTENSSREKCMSVRNGIVTAVTCNGCFDNNKLTLDMQQTKQSSVQCNDDILSESDATGGLHLDTDKTGIQEKQEQLTDAKQPEQPLVEQNELHDARNEQIHESPDVTQEEKVSLECAENKNSEPKHDLEENIIPSSLDNLSINSPDTKSQQLTLTTLVDSKLVQEVNTILSGSKSQEAFGVHKPVPLDTKSGTCSQADIQDEGSNLYHHTKSPAIVAQSKFQQQSNAQSHSNSRHDSPISTASPQIGSSGGSWTQMNHGKHPPEDVTSAHQNIPELQSQQCQVNAQMQYPSAGTSSQVLVDQSHPFQSQVWTSIQGQQANQQQILYQMAAAQPYQTANYAWVGQNMQHQGLVYVHPQPNPQPSSQAQTLVYQQAQQNNEQYGYPHSGQVFAPHLWQHYYQQHFYYLQQQQQQQQQSQLVHNVTEQPSQSAQAQEHQESHSQQLALQSQQLLLQLHQQTSLQPKQQEPEHVSSPEPNSKQPRQQQQVPQVQQQQASQVLQQDEHANQTQQQQQLLYLQQQQQQQMYLHQQHLYMQQLLQQQFYQQQQQQAPQQLLQQQHQQLLMQQQQQLFQLPQQQQQGIGESEIQVQPSSSYMQGEEAKAEQSVRSYSSTPQRTPTTQ